MQHLGVDRSVRARPALPFCSSPLSDQLYQFAVKNTEFRDEMAIPPMSSARELAEFDDGLWEERPLPIFDRGNNLLSPRLYCSLVNATVEVYVVAMHHRDTALDEEGFYFQVRYMRVIQEGTKL